MAALRDFFNADYNYALAVFRTRTFRFRGEELEADERLYQDYRSNAKFIAYFIPPTSHPVDLCRLILDNPGWGLSASDGVSVAVGIMDEPMRPHEDLVFTKLFVFYIDAVLGPERTVAIRLAALERGMVAEVRGREYVERREEARLAAIAAKVVGPDALAALRQKVADFEAVLGTASREEEVHQFLKEQPAILGLTSTIDPISKLPLGSDFVTDLVVNEVPYGYVLVEIERATTRLFKKTSPPERTQELNHAIEQVEQWRAWVSRNHSYISAKLPGISPTPLCWVIAGRDADLAVEGRARLAQINEQQRGGYAVLTYDDLLARVKTVLQRLHPGQAGSGT